MPTLWIVIPMLWLAMAALTIAICRSGARQDRTSVADGLERRVPKRPPSLKANRPADRNDKLGQGPVLQLPGRGNADSISRSRR
jgi:hypothetical protein